MKKKYRNLTKEICPIHNDLIIFGNLDLNILDFKLLFYAIANLNRSKIIKRNEILAWNYDNIKLEPVELEIKEIANDFRIRDYRLIRKSLKKISNTSLSIKRDNEKEINISLFKFSGYNLLNDGKIIIEFNDMLKSFLLPLKYFTKLNLLSILSFKYKYSPMVYSHIKMLKQITNKDEIIIELDNLKTILGLKDYFFNDFNQFRTKILNNIIKDLNNKNCDVKIDKYETIREGRKIKKIKLYIKR